MGAHIVDGEFQSDKYPTCPRGKVPLSVKDAMAQDLLWEYAQRRRVTDAEFSTDVETALRAAGFVPPRVSMEIRLEAWQAVVDWSDDTAACHLCARDTTQDRLHDEDCPLSPLNDWTTVAESL